MQTIGWCWFNSMSCRAPQLRVLVHAHLFKVVCQGHYVYVAVPCVCNLHLFGSMFSSWWNATIWCIVVRVDIMWYGVWTHNTSKTCWNQHMIASVQEYCSCRAILSNRRVCWYFTVWPFAIVSWTLMDSSMCSGHGPKATCSVMCSDVFRRPAAFRMPSSAARPWFQDVLKGIPRTCVGTRKMVCPLPHARRQACTPQRRTCGNQGASLV